MKRCSKCGQSNALDAFCKDSQKKDGLSSWCKGCRAIQGHANFVANRDRSREKTARWRAANPERAKELERACHQRNKEKRNAASIAYRAANRERTRALCRQWAKDNPVKMLMTNAVRRAKKKQAIPAWVDEEFEQLFFKEAYELAKLRTRATGVPWHVDHSVPLKSKVVCGLHCSANIQVITAVENHTKGNRVWPDM